MRLHAILVRPAIAGNIGATMRTCVAYGATLHVIASPLLLDAAPVRRAATRHDELANCVSYESEEDFCERAFPHFSSLVAVTKFAHHRLDVVMAMVRDSLSYPVPRGGDDELTAQLRPASADVGLVFGSESRGLRDLPPMLSAAFAVDGTELGCLRKKCVSASLPMLPAARSLNLAVAVGIALYEASRGSFNAKAESDTMH